MRANIIVSTITILAMSLIALPARAFVPYRPTKKTTTSMQIGNLFGGAFGSSKKESGGGTNTLMDMPGTMKPGALKFFLQIYLVGQQNLSSQGSWALNNNDENESIDMYYKDGTGMFSLVIKDTGLKVDRYGSRPSLEYMLQESIMLHGLLDELTQVAEAEDIEPEKRLIKFQDAEAISKARETLPARKA